ncbi:GNAT family N-acetyltransferase [Brevibacillus choshinensis]|uniref:GNAT family N-acetyltransferase n=1 Tax=Brevibacillus choshinensis TaxID=54911 RepID=A0ABX7FQL8_BRECH|nr:GNAT family N-acetyltransferase [Brevibacillus choshinensis]QRG68539.1 GNAT family N-acetyltransferase [Brevibacillus choshinensis]
MNLLSIVEQSDLAYKQAFSEREVREWGSVFWNEANPNHYDANHAHVAIPIVDTRQASAIIEEVVPFFEEKGIYPRFYLYDQEKQQLLIRELESQGFRSELLPSPIQIWRGELAAVQEAHGIEIEPVTKANYEDCLRVESVPEFGGKEVREKAFAKEFAHPSFRHFLLRVEGEPASSLCLLQAGDIMRIENVATLPAFRGKGLIGHLIRHAQEQFVRFGGAQLWVCPINERVEKVYSRYGFETVGVIPFAHVFRGGKGVLEIR